MFSRVAFLILAGVTATAASALEWKTTSIQIEAQPLAEEAVAAFPFTNSADKPVEILGAHADCGCTTAALTKTRYEPGETGEIRAVFRFDGRVGRQVKTITVSTDEPGSPTYRLTLDVTIPQLIEVRPYFVAWTRGDELTERSISLRALRPDVMRPVAVQSHDARFETRLEPVENTPGAFRVVIKPTSTTEAAQASIAVTMNHPADNPRVVTLYALVRNNAPPRTDAAPAPTPTPAPTAAAPAADSTR